MKHTKRLEELRAILRSETISYGELAELQSLAQHIDPGDVELLEAAGVPEQTPSYKEHCTKAPVRVEPFLGKGGGVCVCVTTAQEKNIVATIHKDRSGHWSDGMDQANAALIAETFNVLHTTGYTPSELVEQVKAYRRELLAITNAATLAPYGWTIDAEDLNDARHTLAKYQPLP